MGRKIGEGGENRVWRDEEGDGDGRRSDPKGKRGGGGGLRRRRISGGGARDST